MLGDLSRLTVAEAAENVRKQSLPATSDDYKIELSKDFVVPQGVEFKFRDGDPLLKQARDLAKEYGLTQDQFSRMLGVYAGAQLADQSSIKAARDAEVSKLGATGPARVTAISTWLDAMGVGGLKARLLTAQDVKDFESLITRHASQGAGTGYQQGGRPPPDEQGKVNDDQWGKMSAAQRLDYARQFPQSQSQPNGAGR